MTATLAFIGLRPIFVTDLGQDAILLHDHGLVLVDSDADLPEVVDWALKRHVEKTLDDMTKVTTR